MTSVLGLAGEATPRNGISNELQNRRIASSQELALRVRELRNQCGLANATASSPFVEHGRASEARVCATPSVGRAAAEAAKRSGTAEEKNSCSSIPRYVAVVAGITTQQQAEAWLCDWPSPNLLHKVLPITPVGPVRKCGHALVSGNAR